MAVGRPCHAIRVRTGQREDHCAWAHAEHASRPGRHWYMHGGRTQVTIAPVGVVMDDYYGTPIAPFAGGTARSASRHAGPPEYDPWRLRTAHGATGLG